MTEREKDDYVMDKLKEKGITLSRAAVMICLYDGILTEEVPFDWYREAIRAYREVEPNYRIPDPKY